MTTSRIASIMLPASGIILIILALDWVQPPDDTFFQREFYNFGHAPLFGFLSLLILALSRQAFSSFHLAREKHYGIALILGILAGTLSEWLQISGFRDADPVDLLRNLIGMISFLAIYYSFDSTLLSGKKRKLRLTKLWCRTIGIVLFFGSLIPLALVSISYLHRDMSFPRIADFESRWGDIFLVPTDARLKRVKFPIKLEDKRDNRAGKLVLGLAEYPGLEVLEVYPNWGNYERLCFEVYSERTDTVSFGVRVNDEKHNNDYYDRFNRTLAITPGLNRIRISIEDIRIAPRAREMDMQRIDAFVLFAINPADSITVYIDNILLE